MEKFIVAGGCALRISDSGPKGDKTIVLLHGYLENLSVWDEFTDLLKSQVRVVALDLPGHGISQVQGPIHTMEFLADTVHAVLEELLIPKCTVIGHSMGGYVALAYAEKYPETLDGLVLFHSTPYPDSPEKKALREREVAAVAAGKKELLSRTAPAMGFAPQNQSRFREEIEGLSELVMLTEEEGIEALLRGMAERKDRSEVLRNLRVPVLFIFGRGDQYIVAETAERMIREFPAAQVAWLEHSGHMGFVEEPEEAARILLEFVSAE